MVVNGKKAIIIILNDDELEDYKAHFKRLYPRKKFPLKSFMWSSVNEWGSKNHHAKNKEKQNYHAFIKYVIDKYKLSDIGLEKASLHYRFFFKTKHLKDLENYCGKFVCDGLVEAGFLKDDNHTILNPITLEFVRYDKENPRVEMIFKLPENNDGVNSNVGE